MQDEARTVWEHIAELRKKIIICVTFFILGATITHIFHEDIIAYLIDFIKGENLIFLGPLDAFFFILKIDLLGGFILSLPLIIWSLLSYISPALPEKIQKKITLILVISLFLIAFAVAYALFFTIPISLNFLLSISLPGIQQSITAENYLSFILNQLLILIIIFQLPLIITSLVNLDIVQRKTLERKRKVAYFIIVVTAAVITPTADIVNLLIVALPCIILFEATLFTLRFQKKKEIMQSL